jgi:retinol dehydrogenase-14
MNERVYMVTGGTSGIGKATALGLAKMGATVVVVGRSRERGEAALAEIKAESGNLKVELMLADLASQTALRRLAEEFKNKYQRLDALVNNAGVFLTRRTLTEDGIELHFAVNYLAQFLLTNLLLDLLKASAPARVVNVAGEYHRKATLDFDDLMCEKDYTAAKASNRSKLAVVLFTYELARRLEGSGVTANCLHPGAVATDPLSKDPDSSALARFFYKLMSPFFLSPERGAETSIYLASSPEVKGVTGKYFIKKAPVQSSPESYDKAVAARLWQVSAELTGLNET